MIPVPATATTRPQLVGREDEIARLIDVAELAVEHGAQMVLLSGEAGMGKTSVAVEALAQLKADGWSTHVGHCVELVDHEVPFGPIIAILRSVLLDNLEHVDELIGHRRHDLARLLPELGEVEPSGAAEVGGLFDAVGSCLAAAAAVRPSVLLIEDIHWSDAATRDLIAWLVRSLGPARVLLIVTERDGLLADQRRLRIWLAEHRRMVGVHHLSLAGLATDEIALLADDVSGELAVQLAERTGGNPYYRRELLAAHRDGVAGLPPSLIEFLISRLRRFGDGERELLKALAIASQPVSSDLLAVVLPEQSVDEPIRSLFDASIIATEGSGWVIAPALLSEAILHDVLPFEHEDLQSRLAGPSTPPKPAGADNPHFLTDREVKVLSLVAEGLTNKAIGERLFVSPRTVSTHVSNLLAKLGVTNRGEATATYHRLNQRKTIDLRDA